MKQINFQKDVLPNLVAVGVFLFIIFIFFYPQIFENKEMYQHDVFQGRAAGEELATARKNGESALWMNSMFSGMPGYLVQVDYKDTVLKYLSTVLSLGLPNPARYVFLSFLCYYIMLLSFGVRPYLAIAGSLAFGLTSFTMISLTAGHNSKIHAISYWPLVIAGIRLVIQKKYLLFGAALTAVAVGLELKANHLQMTYYLLLIVAAYGIAELIHHIVTKQFSTFSYKAGVLIVAALIGVLANFGRLWTVYEYGKYTIRGKSELTVTEESGEKPEGLDKEYAFKYSNGITEPLVMFVPNILGGPTTSQLDEDSNLGEAMRSQGVDRGQISQQLSSVPTYWGDQPGTAPYYAGAITLLLFIIGLLFAERRHIIWLTAIAVFGVMLTWGKNFEAFNYFLFDYFPGYNKFRSVTFAIIIPIFCMPLLGMLGLEKLLASELNKETWKKLQIAGGITAGFMALLVIGAGMITYRGPIDAQLASLPDWFISALREDRKSLLRADAIRSLVFIVLAFGVIWAMLKQKINGVTAGFALVVLIGLDVGMVGKRFLSTDTFVRDPYKRFVRATEADKFIKQSNKEGKRVLYLPNPFNEAKHSYHHASIGGYHGAKLGRYQDVISRSLSGEIQQAITSLRSGSRDFSQLEVLNMLNTGYLIAGDERNAVINNPSTNGHAWFVNQIVKVSSPDEEIAKLNQISTKNSAVVDTNKFPVSGDSFSSGSIRLQEKKNDYLKYEYDNRGEGLAIFSEVYFEAGWEATIDGNPTDIIRANYVLRALRTPAGKHTIEFSFKPSSFATGTTISTISGILLLLFFA
ncbi:MAG: YfhO family protein, partial [Bacteroidota bacterium]